MYRDVTDHLQNVPSAHRVSSHHGDHRLGQAPYLHLRVCMSTHPVQQVQVQCIAPRTRHTCTMQR